MRVEAWKSEVVPDDVRIEVGPMVITDQGSADQAGEQEGRRVFEESGAQRPALVRGFDQCATVRFLRRKSMSTASPRSYGLVK